MAKEGVCVLGSTGSVGRSALDVVARHSHAYSVEVLTANTNVDRLFEQCLKFNPRRVVLLNESRGVELSKKLKSVGSSVEVFSGQQAIDTAADLPSIDIVIAAIVGAAGLLPTLLAVKRGLKVLLANKEALVMSGEIFMSAVKESGAILLPVDSEHNAIFQCLPPSKKTGLPLLEGVKKVVLTGSGGPFRTLPFEHFSSVTPEEACTHPNWNMGKKISVDSATMMNKGLELIEACFLFGLEIGQVELVIHPQSIVHSMVAYADGSVLAQMGKPDMRTPIAHTLAWPKRVDSGVEPLDFFSLSNLVFEKPDFERFPCLNHATAAMRAGGTAPCMLNAANEVAVFAFLNNQIKFTDISKIIGECMALFKVKKAASLDVVLAADKEARELANVIIDRLERE